MRNALSLKTGRALNDYKALPGLQPHNWKRWFTLAVPFGVHQLQCPKWRHLSHPRNYTLRKQNPDEASGIQKEWRKVKCSSKRTVEGKPRNYFLWCKDPPQLCIGIKGLGKRAAQSPRPLRALLGELTKLALLRGLFISRPGRVGSHLDSLDLKMKFTKVNYLTSRRRGVQGRYTEVDSEP